MFLLVNKSYSFLIVQCKHFSTISGIYSVLDMFINIIDELYGKIVKT